MQQVVDADVEKINPLGLTHMNKGECCQLWALHQPWPKELPVSDLLARLRQLAPLSPRCWHPRCKARPDMKLCYNLGSRPTKFSYPYIAIALALQVTPSMTFTVISPAAIQPPMQPIPSSFTTTIPQIPIIWPTSYVCHYLSMEHFIEPATTSSSCHSQVTVLFILLRFHRGQGSWSLPK